MRNIKVSSADNNNLLLAQTKWSGLRNNNKQRILRQTAIFMILDVITVTVDIPGIYL